MVRTISLAMLLGLQPAVGQFCRNQFSCLTCLTFDGCVWNATGASCLEGWEYSKCAGDRTCLNHPCSCGILLPAASPIYGPFSADLSYSVASTPLYSKTLLPAISTGAPLYSSTAASVSSFPIVSASAAPIYTSSTVRASYPIVASESLVFPTTTVTTAAPIYTNNLVTTSYPVVSVAAGAPIYTNTFTPLYNRRDVGGGNGGNGGLNIDALLLAGLLANGGLSGGLNLPGVGAGVGVSTPPVVTTPPATGGVGAGVGVVFPPVNGGVGVIVPGVTVPPISGGVEVIIPPVGGVGASPIISVPGVGVPPINVDIDARVKKMPPAWGARYIAGTKPQLANPGPFPAGIAGNILARGGKLNNGNLLNLDLDAGLNIKGGGNPFVKDILKGGNGNGLLNLDVTGNLLGGGNGKGGGNAFDNILKADIASGVGGASLLDVAAAVGGGKGKGNGASVVGSVLGKGKSGKRL